MDLAYDWRYGALEFAKYVQKRFDAAIMQELIDSLESKECQS